MVIMEWVVLFTVIGAVRQKRTPQVRAAAATAAD